MKRLTRCLAAVVFVGAFFSGTAKVGANHGYECAAYCDSHTGDQCPEPPPAWYSCVGQCLYAVCNGNQSCISNGEPEAAEWCGI
jgi:hypothetical protein